MIENTFKEFLSKELNLEVEDVNIGFFRECGKECSGLASGPREAYIAIIKSMEKYPDKNLVEDFYFKNILNKVHMGTIRMHARTFCGSKGYILDKEVYGGYEFKRGEDRLYVNATFDGTGLMVSLIDLSAIGVPERNS